MISLLPLDSAWTKELLPTFGAPTSATVGVSSSATGSLRSILAIDFKSSTHRPCLE